MELTLLRHGALGREHHDRYNGHTDISIDEGLFEAHKAASLFQHPFDQIYSSDLSRCTQTLHLLGFDHFIPDARLREVCFKPQFEGKTFVDIEKMSEYDPHFLDSMESWHHFVCKESLQAFRKRLQNFLTELPLHGTVLICTHAGVIREILAFFHPEEKLETLGYLEYRIVRVK
jgi:alpha-ribazole phosphatase/probable phosphoglycerate mutase